VAKLPPAVRSLKAPAPYPVARSAALEKLSREVAARRKS
jgi:hypothetical protein